MFFKKEKLITYILASILLLSGGLSWFFVKSHAGYKLPVEFSVFYRNMGSSIFIFLLMNLLGKGKIFKINKEELKVILKVAFLYYFCYFMGSYHASVFLVSGLVAFISSTKTIFVEFLLSLKEKRKPAKRILLAAVVGSIGIFLISKSNMKISNLTLSQLLFGIAFAFVAPVSNSISYVIIKTSPAKKTLNNFALACYGSFIGSILVLLVGLIKYKSITPMPLDAKYVIGWVYLAFGASGLITVISYYLIEKIGPSKTTMMSLAHSPLALTLAVLFQGYVLDANTAIGMTMCICALYFGLSYKNKQK